MVLKLQTPPPTPPLEGRGEPRPTSPKEGKNPTRPPRRGGGATARPDGKDEWLLPSPRPSGITAQRLPSPRPSGITAQRLPSPQGEGLGVGSVLLSYQVIHSRLLIRYFFSAICTSQAPHRTVTLFYKPNKHRREAVLFGSRSGAFRLKKHRFSHRKGPLLFIDYCKTLKDNRL